MTETRMNAKVADDNRNYERILGKEGLEVQKHNGNRLCGSYDMNKIVITGTLFIHKNIHKATWVSPDGATGNQIDRILVNKRFGN